ncbi:fungal-specific transcription factor domain-containing protein [Cyathus striatus]|nr:fungal-specific transcription factor domain-containing protein [Cyathus striatus]
MHHLETLIQAIPPAVFAAGGMPPHSAPTPAETASPIAPLQRQRSPSLSFGGVLGGPYFNQPSIDQMTDETSRISLTASYLYIDDEGYTRWQGETSGLPVLDLLVERRTPSTANGHENGVDRVPGEVVGNGTSNADKIARVVNSEWFPNRTPRRTDVNPQMLWRLITSSIVPELMDSLVQCYLSTSYYILPFLHVPTFLADYGNPQKWGEPGFAAFIVSVCCLASRHMDDPRVRADPNDGISAGTQWFELLHRLRTLPIADRPTLYNIQANLIAAVYAVGLGKLSKAAALLAEAVTMCIDAGMHRSADTYDLFDPIEDEVRKRTFWCVYIWDKQLGAHFGRPPMLRLRDCDVAEPAPVDDEFITREAVGMPPPGTECRLGAFIIAIRIMVVLESVLDVPPTRQADDPSSFLLRATSLLSSGRRFKEMREEESLLDDIHRSIPPYWANSPETQSSEDTIRFTQAERLHCAEQFVRMLIHRHRFSELFAERTASGAEEEQTEVEREAMVAAHNSALQIVSAHLHIAKKGLMTYYGVHVIHQLTQAGRTLVAVLLLCKSDEVQPLIPPGLDALRSCIGLLRRFSGRYVCGLRSGDLMEEFCRLTNIPLDPTPQPPTANSSRPPWIRPIRKKTSSVARSAQSDSPSQHSSPEAFSPSDFFAEPTKNPAAFAATAVPPTPTAPAPTNHTSPGQYSAQPQAQTPTASGFMETGGIPMELIREDQQMYMSPDMMALFNDGGVDVGHLFSPDYNMQQQQGQGPPTDRQGGVNPTHGASPASFGSPAFLKMNGLATSP